MSLTEDIARMGQLARAAESGTTTIYSAGGEAMRLFLAREAEIIAAIEAASVRDCTGVCHVR